MKKQLTGEILEFHVGLGAVGVEIGVVGVEEGGLSEQIDGEGEIVVKERVFGFGGQFRRHWREKERYFGRRRGQTKTK